ncbi:MAG: Na/Pi cotransporter family protein, partial [Victivallaceae bacterium]
GLLTLTQSIGIIFGANIGTTVTAQIISFNLSGIALPAITLGFLISLAGREEIKGWGESILGFGLLFFGMMMMSDELKMLGTFPTFVNVFHSFDCTPREAGGWMPFGAVLGAIGIGVAATVLIQSSSAAMGIILALAAGGLINFYTAVPLLLGTNIGTTITAFLASLAANRVAKQAAIAHAMFNVLGALLMVGLLYVPYGPHRIPVFLYFVNAMTPGDVFAAIPQGMERHIAMAHTFFNVIVTLILLPFIGAFARFCEFLLPIRNQSELATVTLEPNLLASPSIALEQVVLAIRQMVNDSWTMLDTAVNTHFLKGKIDEKSFRELAEAEEKIDRMQAEVTDYLVRITRRELSEPQSALVPLLMHCTNDAERLADHTENILVLTRRMVKLSKGFSEDARRDLEKVWSLLDAEAKSVISALGSTNPADIEQALRNERKINKLADKYESEHIDRLRKGSCNPALSVIYIEMLGELEKLGDHLTNIAERTPEMQKHYIKL